MEGAQRCSCATFPNGWVYLFGPFGACLGIGRARDLDELMALLAIPQRWVPISGNN
jgi:hypothetical protein